MAGTIKLDGTTFLTKDSSNNFTLNNVTDIGSVTAGTISSGVDLPNKHNRCISRITWSAFSSSAMDPVDATWTIDNIGNSDEIMTESGGIWSFPSTGIWRMKVVIIAHNNDNTAFNMENCSWLTYLSTNSGSSWTHINSAQNYVTFPANDWYRQQLHGEHIFDVTNKDTTKVKFVLSTNPSTNVYWASGNQAYIYFFKLGET